MRDSISMRTTTPLKIQSLNINIISYHKIKKCHDIIKNIFVYIAYVVYIHFNLGHGNDDI